MVIVIKMCVCVLKYMWCVYREVDETKDWIHEKDTALNNDNYGHDLASTQALQRKTRGPGEGPRRTRGEGRSPR